MMDVPCNIYVDAATLLSNPSIICSYGVAVELSGKLLYARHGRLFAMDNNLAELHALRHGLTIAHNCGLWDFTIHSDNRPATVAVNGGTVAKLRRRQMLVDDVRCLLTDSNGILLHTSRNTPEMLFADFLANCGLHRDATYTTNKQLLYLQQAFDTWGATRHDEGGATRRDEG